MFQQYAVTYTLDNAERGATTSTVETDPELTPDENKENAKPEIKKMIACRRWGRPEDATRVTLTEVARLGDPTETPVENP